MEEVVRAFLSSRLGMALALIVAIVVGFWLRDWTYRNVHNSRSCWNATRGADLRREAKERKRLQRQNRKKYAYLKKKVVIVVRVITKVTEVTEIIKIQYSHG